MQIIFLRNLLNKMLYIMIKLISLSICFCYYIVSCGYGPLL